MGFLSFLNKKKDPFADAMEQFLKTQDASILYSNLILYMGYGLSDMENDSIKKYVHDTYNQLVNHGISYISEPIFRSESSFSIYNILRTICKCDHKLAKRFENDVCTLFGIDEIYRMDLGR